MIITIDGPAGAGKSTVARRLARRLGFRFLNTGAMYRAIVRAALDEGIALEDGDALASFAERLELFVDENVVRVNGRDVADRLATPEINASIHFVADNPRIRAHLVQLQREFGRQFDVVTEGRDQGTVAFPNADCKIYLDASLEERAQRRQREQTAKGIHVTLDEVRRQVRERDQRDTARAEGGLRQADDAIPFPTDGLDVDQVVDGLTKLVGKQTPSPPDVNSPSGPR